jgi:hypothetical protein
VVSRSRLIIFAFHSCRPVRLENIRICSEREEEEKSYGCHCAPVFDSDRFCHGNADQVREAEEREDDGEESCDRRGFVEIGDEWLWLLVVFAYRGI